MVPYKDGFSQVEDCEVASPWTDRYLVALRQRLCDLMKVIKIVDSPCCQEMPQLHSPQDGMFCLAIKLGGFEA